MKKRLAPTGDWRDPLADPTVYSSLKFDRCRLLDARYDSGSDKIMYRSETTPCAGYGLAGGAVDGFVSDKLLLIGAQNTDVSNYKMLPEPGVPIARLPLQLGEERLKRAS